jgi:hypothetical protein
VIDLGLRLEDIEGLERERVTYRGDPTLNLEYNGATEEEINILVQQSDWRGYEGHRVELNAMTSDQFIKWLERKLNEHGIKKLIPDSKSLVSAYKRAVFLQRIHKEVDILREEIIKQPIIVPNGLKRKVQDILRKQPELPWDEAIWNLAKTPS